MTKGMIVFQFIDNVPVGIRSLIEHEISAWIDRADYPVYGLKLPNGVHVDFCRRPWPPSQHIPATVGSERDYDETLIEEYLASRDIAKR
jgi:hypothetical protein